MPNRLSFYTGPLIRFYRRQSKLWQESVSFSVIADVTNLKSSPLELQATVPDYQIPFVPIIQEGEQPFAMMVDLQKKYNWVLGNAGPTKLKRSAYQ